MELQFSAKTDIGLKRKINEDCVYVNEQIGLCAIADGMGGHSAGDVASRMVIDIIEESFSDFEPTDDESIREAINETIQLANYAVKTSASQNPEQRGMGSTITLLYFFDNKYYVAQVGDSRAYLIRDNQIFQLTEDHSLVQQELDKGLITEEEAESHVFKNIITRAVGIKDEVEVDFYADRIADGDFLLICSDGLTNKVSNLDILKEVTSGNTLDSITSSLIELANLRDGSDNISIALTKVGAPVYDFHVEGKSERSKKGLLILMSLVAMAAIAGTLFVFQPWTFFMGGDQSPVESNQPSPVATQDASITSDYEKIAATAKETKDSKEVELQTSFSRPQETAVSDDSLAEIIAEDTDIFDNATDATPTIVPKRPTEKPTPFPTVKPTAIPPVSDNETFDESGGTGYTTTRDMSSMGEIYNAGIRQFNMNDLNGALITWNNMLYDTSAKYTLQIEVDSKEESVRSTFSRYNNLDLFVLKKGRRYYVYCGLFKTRTEAEQGLQALPEGIRSAGPMIREIAGIRLNR